MAQHDQVIDNGPGRAVRLDINAAMAALFSTNSGVLEPTVTVGGQLWFDDSDPDKPRLMLRNASNTGWLDIATDLSASNFVYTSGAFNIAAGDITNFIQWSATGTANLPDATGLDDSWWVTISAFGGPVTIAARVGQLIDGVASILIPKGTTVDVRATGDGINFRSSGIPFSPETFQTVVGSLPTASTVATNDQLIVVHADGTMAKVSKDLFGSPAGTVLDFAGQTTPAAHLPANGAAVSRTTYSVLFGIIGTTYGAGDGSTTFNLPDTRGVVKRGWDNGRGLDTGRAFGSYQADLLGSHNHGVSDPGHSHAVIGSNGTVDYGSAFSRVGLGNVNNINGYTNAVGTGISIAAAGGVETRMKNIAFLGIIKY